MESRNNLTVATLATLCLVLTFSCGLLLIDRGGVLGESTTAALVRATPTRSRPSLSPPTRFVTPTQYPTPTGSLSINIPCAEINRLYTAYCRTIPTSYPTSIRITPTKYPTPTPKVLY